MKRMIIAIIAMMCLLITNCIPVYANTIYGPNLTDEISEEDKNLIFQKTYEFINNRNEIQITENDIDYNKALKIYTNIDILNETGLNNEKLQEYTESAVCCYYVPIHFENESIDVILNKGTELTARDRANTAFSDEDIEYFENMVGRWYVVGEEVWEQRFDYIDHIEGLLEENNITDANVYVLGGISGNLATVAAVCQGDEDAGFLILNGWDTEEHLISYENPSNRIYSHEELKALAEIGGEIQPDQYGAAGLSMPYEENGNNIRNIFIAAGAATAAFAAAVIIACAVKKKRKTAYEQIQ